MSKKVEAIRKQSAVADMNAKIRDSEIESESPAGMLRAAQELIDDYQKATGINANIYTARKQNARVAFSQTMTHNLQCLIRHQYLTDAESSFLFNIQALLQFSTNIILEEESKNDEKKKKKEEAIAKIATIEYLEDYFGKHRTNVSRVMNSLKRKGVLGIAETGLRTEDGRFTSGRIWLVNPNVLYCGDKADIDSAVQMIFRDALKNRKDKDGKKIRLPVDLFL